MFNNAFLSGFLGDTPPKTKSIAAPLLPTNSGLIGGSGDPETPMAKEMRQLAGRTLTYDNIPAKTAALNAAKSVGVNPALFFSSAFQEGFNKAIVNPNEVSGAYSNAQQGIYDNGKGIKGTQDKFDSKAFPVDGFYNYGTDTFSDRATGLIAKGYLPKDFKYQPYKAVNEKGEIVNTAAFPNNQAALTAKAAILRDTMDKVQDLAKKKGLSLDNDALNYFSIAAYNSGEGNADKMMNAFAKSKDKKSWLKNGDSQWQKVHRNIAPRLQNLKTAEELLTEK